MIAGLFSTDLYRSPQHSECLTVISPMGTSTTLACCRLHFPLSRRLKLSFSVSPEPLHSSTLPLAPDTSWRHLITHSRGQRSVSRDPLLCTGVMGSWVPQHGLETTFSKLNSRQAIKYKKEIIPRTRSNISQYYSILDRLKYFPH